MKCKKKSAFILNPFNLDKLILNKIGLGHQPVIPAYAGIQGEVLQHWIPAYAGMTVADS